MARLLVQVALGFLLSVLGCPAVAQPAANPPHADHVVLVSVDGLRPEFYLDRTWPAPMLQQMVAEGVHAEAVRPVYPSVTYPTHASIVTGALPARHGVVYNSRFVPGHGEELWYWEEEHVRVPTLWDAVRAAGRTTANVGWPVSVGAPIDRNLPEVRRGTWQGGAAVEVSGRGAARGRAAGPGVRGAGRDPAGRVACGGGRTVRGWGPC